MFLPMGLVAWKKTLGVCLLRKRRVDLSRYPSVYSQEIPVIGQAMRNPNKVF